MGGVGGEGLKLVKREVSSFVNRFGGPYWMAFRLLQGKRTQYTKN